MTAFKNGNGGADGAVMLPLEPERETPEASSPGPIDSSGSSVSTPVAPVSSPTLADYAPPVGAPVELAPPGPRWGLIDVGLAVPVIFAAVIVATLITLAFVGIPSTEPGQPLDVNALLSKPALVVVPGLVQQAAMAGWVVFVARRKGSGVVADFGGIVLPKDLGLGLVAALAALVGSSVVIQVAQRITGADAAGNTDIIGEASSNPWLPVIIFMVVVGAPVSEELFFRGLLLRSLENRWSTPVAAIGSTVAFSIVHLQGDVTSTSTLLLLLGIAIYGVVQALIVIRTGRLGPAIVSHMMINGAVTALVLAQPA